MKAIVIANALFLRGKHRAAFDKYMDIVKAYPDPIAATDIGYMYQFRRGGKVLA